MEDNSSKWSDEKAEWLHREEFLAEILKLRTAKETAKPARPWWQRLLESSGGTALITVLLGGLLGQWINLSIQRGLKDREFQQQWLKARGDQALASYNQYLDQENEIVQKTYELVGDCISAAADLIILTSPEFAPGSHTEIDAQRTAIRDRYNAVDARWRGEKEKLGLLMSYYHHGQPEVVKAWNEAQEAVTDYMDVSRGWYLEHYRTPVDVSQACDREKEFLKDKLVNLTTALEASRRHAWEGWESPEKLRSVLQKDRWSAHQGFLRPSFLQRFLS